MREEEPSPDETGEKPTLDIRLSSCSQRGVFGKRAVPCSLPIFLTHHLARFAAFIPHVGELVRCRLSIGKGHFATLWHVKEVEHGVGLDRLSDVTLVVEAADTQTAMHWRRYPRESAE